MFNNNVNGWGLRIMFEVHIYVQVIRLNFAVKIYSCGLRISFNIVI
jgi:hypothetical protein